MEILSLNGTWRVQAIGKSISLPAHAPGCIHLDLLRARKIQNPFYRDREKELAWIGQTPWNYTREFSLGPEFLRHEKVLLRCHGLDTLASITVNGKPVGKTDNMYRTYEFDVRSILKSGRNQIAVRFDDAISYITQRQKEQPLVPLQSNHRIIGSSHIRKEPCNFGWDWGPMLVTCGIWRPIELVGFDTARLADLRFEQDHLPGDGGVHLATHVRAEILDSAASLTVEQTLRIGGEVVAESRSALAAGEAEISAHVAKPKLWWPNGLGDQPLYEVEIRLLGATGTVLDSVKKRLGLRTLDLVQQRDPWGQSFHFRCNGVDFFAKGANWIPADTFAPRLTRADYSRWLGDAAAVHMNMIRCWGGGIYEDDAFYDRCDELGLVVWQDFMFACSAYPGDRAFLENVRAEAEDNVRRIRHHACLGLWCGNNEIEQLRMVGNGEARMPWPDYHELFDRLLPSVVEAHDPGRAYIPSSEYSPIGDRTESKSPDWGDAHLWDVWHGRKPFEHYRTCLHRFCSEFGFQSFPEPRTIAAFAEPEDRNITSYVMEYHQRSGIGNDAILQYMASWFQMPKDFDSLCHLSQILQAMAMKYAVEHWRRNMPRCMGALYWQLNDCWPGPTWASIDYLGRWKVLHHLAAGFFAPRLVSAVEDLASGKIAVHLSNDLRANSAGEVQWILTTAGGRRLEAGKLPAKCPAGSSVLLKTLDFSKALAAQGKRNLMFWVEWIVDGAVVSSNLATFERPKHLLLEDPMIETEVSEPAEGELAGPFTVTLTARKSALYVHLEVEEDPDAQVSSAHFHLRPGQRQVMTVTPSDSSLSAKKLRKRLAARSLWDTFAATAPGRGKDDSSS